MEMEYQKFTGTAVEQFLLALKVSGAVEQFYVCLIRHKIQFSSLLQDKQLEQSYPVFNF